MTRTMAIAAAVSLLAACGERPAPASGSICDIDPESALGAVIEAHGGADAWRRLESIYVEREHLFAGSEQPIRFNIHGEYPTHRIYQAWQVPPGTLAWDGERAWSAGWPLADRLMPRYVAAIGFYLVNMPWFVQEIGSALESRGCSGTLPGHGDRRFLVIVANYEPDPVRKPAWYEGPRDRYELYIDPESHLLSGIMQHWTYAGRLDAADAPASAEAISQLFVPESFVEVNGLTWPHEYTAYTPEGEVAAHGRFFDYDFSRPFDASLLFPADPGSLQPDTSSSYFRGNQRRTTN